MDQLKVKDRILENISLSVKKVSALLASFLTKQSFITKLCHCLFLVLTASQIVNNFRACRCGQAALISRGEWWHRAGLLAVIYYVGQCMLVVFALSCCTRVAQACERSRSRTAAGKSSKAINKLFIVISHHCDINLKSAVRVWGKLCVLALDFVELYNFASGSSCVLVPCLFLMSVNPWTVYIIRILAHSDPEL